MNEKTVTPMTRIVTVKAGDSLASIAKTAYGDEKLAEYLSKVNGIAQSAILTVGTILRVPHRSQIQKALVHKEPHLGALPTDIPQDAVPGMLAPITASAAPAWWMDQKVWLSAGVGFAVAWLLLSKNSPLKM